MIRRPIQQYFFFGTAVRYLQDASAGYQIANYDDGGWAVRSNLEQIFSVMGTLNLRVSSQTDAARELRVLLEEFSVANEKDALTAEQASKLTRYVKELRQTLEAELRATYAYSLVQKRIDISRLVEDPASLFGPKVYAKLPAIAQYDIAEAGRCIAFELPTAAAFHLMWATEAVLRQLYVSVVRTRRHARMWGEIVADIRKRHVGKEHTVLLNQLDHIRQAFRNPTQHPEARYDIHEVQDLWSIAVDVINRMATRL